MNQTVEGIYKLIPFGVGIVTQSFLDVLHHLVAWSIHQSPSTQGQKGDTASSPRVNARVSDGRLLTIS